MIRLLFVCHGNICRSPICEFVFKSMVAERNLSHEFQIDSAATSDEEIWNGKGNPVYPPARKILAEHGISCQGKTARQMTREDYDKYDYLIGMDEQNRRNMLRICHDDPEGKISLLMDHTDQPHPVADPWYTGDFESTYRDAVIGCTALLEEILKKSFSNT